MTNEIMATEGNELAASEETCLKIVEPVQNYSQIGKFMDKIIADGKDERYKHKKSYSSRYCINRTSAKTGRTSNGGLYTRTSEG